MVLKKFVNEHACTFSILACIFLTITYVASLYIWRSTYSRDHPVTIKRRFFSVTCMMILAPFISYYFWTEETLNRGDLLEHMGLRFSGLIQAIVLPLFLTCLLFLGPMTMQYYSGTWNLYTEPMYWVASFQDLVWVRNHVMAPLSEEWVFRSCMVPLLFQCLEPYMAVIIGPLLFGIAHFHHMFEQIKSGQGVKTALLVSSFQFMYTSMFGVYSAYLFIRTGHFVAPLIAHMYCNHMGFPNFGEIMQFQPLQRLVIVFDFIVGFTFWCITVVPFTHPYIYENRLYWET